MRRVVAFVFSASQLLIELCGAGGQTKRVSFDLFLSPTWDFPCLTAYWAEALCIFTRGRIDITPSQRILGPVGLAVDFHETHSGLLRRNSFCSHLKHVAFSTPQQSWTPPFTVYNACGSETHSKRVWQPRREEIQLLWCLGKPFSGSTMSTHTALVQ